MTTQLDKLRKSVVCPVELALRVFGGKWRGSIMYQLRRGPLRFNDLKLRVQDAVVYHDDEDHFLSNKVLTEHLYELMAYYLVEKLPGENGNTGHFTYRLTEKGRSAVPLLLQLYDWGDNNL